MTQLRALAACPPRVERAIRERGGEVRESSEAFSRCESDGNLREAAGSGLRPGYRRPDKDLKQSLCTGEQKYFHTLQFIILYG